MAKRTLPGVGLTGFWDVGADYKTEMDANMRTLSALVQPVAKSRTTNLPGSGSIGDIYIVPAAAGSNDNQIAIWDGESGSEAWVYLVPQEGWTLYVEDTQTRVAFDGSTWIADTVAGSDLVAAIDLYFGNTEWRDATQFKGVYLNQASLLAAHPTGTVGNYAFVDAGPSIAPIMYVWDGDDNEWAQMQGGGGGTMTGAEIETVLDAYYGNTDWRTPGSGGGISDAPSDGKQYARQDGAWAEVVAASAGGGSSLKHFRHTGLTSASVSGTGSGYHAVPFAAASANDWQPDSTPASEVVVPAGVSFAELSVGLRSSDGSVLEREVFIQKWNGSDWDFLTGHRYSGGFPINQASTGVIPVAEGDRFRFAYYTNGGWNADQNACFWSVEHIAATEGGSGSGAAVAGTDLIWEAAVTNALPTTGDAASSSSFNAKGNQFLAAVDMQVTHVTFRTGEAATTGYVVAAVLDGSEAGATGATVTRLSRTDFPGSPAVATDHTVELEAPLDVEAGEHVFVAFVRTDGGPTTTSGAYYSDLNGVANWNAQDSSGDWSWVSSYRVSQTLDWQVGLTMNDNLNSDDPWSVTFTHRALATIKDAPSDGKQYARQDGAWAEVAGGSAASVIGAEALLGAEVFASRRHTGQGNLNAASNVYTNQYLANQTIYINKIHYGSRSTGDELIPVVFKMDIIGNGAQVTEVLYVGPTLSSHAVTADGTLLPNTHELPSAIEIKEGELFCVGFMGTTISTYPDIYASTTDNPDHDSSIVETQGRMFFNTLTPAVGDVETDFSSSQDVTVNFSYQGFNVIQDVDAPSDSKFYARYNENWLEVDTRDWLAGVETARMQTGGGSNTSYGHALVGNTYTAKKNLRIDQVNLRSANFRTYDIVVCTLDAATNTANIVEVRSVTRISAAGFTGNAGTDQAFALTIPAYINEGEHFLIGIVNIEDDDVNANSNILINVSNTTTVFDEADHNGGSRLASLSPQPGDALSTFGFSMYLWFTTATEVPALGQITGDVTLDASYFNGKTHWEVSAAAVITVPENLVIDKPATFEQTGTGEVSFVAGANATVNSLNGELKLAGQFAAGTLVPKGGDVFSLIGNLKA